MPKLNHCSRALLILSLLAACQSESAQSPAAPVHSSADNQSESSVDQVERPAVPVLSPDAPGANSDGDPKPAVVTTPASGLSQADIDSLSRLIEGEMQTQNIPGLSVALVKGDRTLWQAGFGIADLSTGRKVTADTPFIIASISKAVTYINLLQLYDQGRVQLDVDINQYLPFSVRNPNFPDQVITIRMLMTHMSSLKDSGIDVYTRGADTPIALANFVRDYFTPGQTYYNAEENFYAQAPGTQVNYSNMGTALAGFVVESVAKVPFYQFSQTNLFAPLTMNHSSWLLKDADLSQLAIPYDEDNTPFLHYTFPDYPNGQLRSSTSDMARFLRMLINQGRSQNQTILGLETIAEMRKVQTPTDQTEYGLGLTYDEQIPGAERRLLGHSGSEQGAESVMYYDTQTQSGVVILMNKQDKNTTAMMKGILAVGDRY